MTRVLLVDDDEMSRDMLSRRLIRRGFDVIFAVDGKQGVEAARREKPDIILMDMGLPVMDGWEATRCIKSDDATRGVSVIGLSARTMSGDRDKAIEAGCDDYDIKPIEFDRLIGKIERLLGLAKIQVLATLREFAIPSIGIATTASAACSTSDDTPLLSPPRTKTANAGSGLFGDHCSFELRRPARP
jgi:two-component system cell cycle response regulator DivK